MIIAFIFTIYFCRCCKWSHDTNDIFKDVDKDIVVNYKEAIPVKPTANGKDTKDIKVDPDPDFWHCPRGQNF